MQTKDGGKHDILPVARPRRDHARMPVIVAPPIRRKTVPPFTDEHEGVHGTHQSGRTRTRETVLPRWCTITGMVSVKNPGDPQWHRRRRHAQLRRQDKSADRGLAHVVGKIEEFTNVTNTRCWRFLQIVQAFQGFERHRSESPGGAGPRRPATTTCASGPAVSSTASAAASLRRVLSAR